MNKSRFSILTFNLWNTEQWEVRAKTVRSFLETFEPDICCFQELRPPTVAFLDGVLKNHIRIQDSFPGWTGEGNMYFRKDLFTEIEHGCVDLSMPEKDRRLFWVRLRLQNDDKTLLVSTVHLTHQGNEDEMATGISYRHKETLLASSALDNLIRKGEAALVAGDFNDPFHPVRLFSQIGFSEVFNSLGLLQPVTFPSQPVTGEIIMNEAIDKIMARGPLRPLLASVPQYYAHGTSASDHWPVIAVYEY